MSYQEIACLVLKTSILPMDGPNNAYGTSNSTNTIFTWTNINLRTLLGDMFDKYDRYLLLLQSISTAVAGTIGADNDDRCCIINMSGLSFVNSTYSQKLQSNSGYLAVVPITFKSSDYILYNYQNFSVSTFIKQNDIVNISINYTKIKTDAAVSTVNAFPHVVFYFNIVGLEEYRVKDFMNNRLLK